MPTVARVGPYRFFYSNEGDEPPHVHVERERGGATAKFWLDPVGLARSGFAGTESSAIRRLVEQQRMKFKEAWHDYFDR